MTDAPAAERPATSAELEALRAELAETRELLERLLAVSKAQLARKSTSKRYAAPAPRSDALSDEERERIRKTMAAPKPKRRRRA